MKMRLVEIVKNIVVVDDDANNDVVKKFLTEAASFSRTKERENSVGSCLLWHQMWESNEPQLKR